MRWLAGLALSAVCSAPALAQPPGPHMDTPAVRDERLQILRNERADVQRKLTTAVNGLLSAPNQAEALKNVARLQDDLQALDNEIRRVESPAAASSSTSSAPTKPAASAAGPVNPGSKASGDFEPWDVFKNFAKKGTP
jgi:hypothetical protein